MPVSLTTYFDEIGTCVQLRVRLKCEVVFEQILREFWEEVAWRDLGP